MNGSDQISFYPFYIEHVRRAINRDRDREEGEEEEKKKNGSMHARSLVDNIQKKTGYIAHTHIHRKILIDIRVLLIHAQKEVSKSRPTTFL